MRSLSDLIGEVEDVIKLCHEQGDSTALEMSRIYEQIHVDLLGIMNSLQVVIGGTDQSDDDEIDRLLLSLDKQGEKE